MAVGTASDQDGSKALRGPAFRIGWEITTAAAAPAVVLDIQVEGWRTVEVGLECECLLSLSPAIHQPSKGQFTRRELHLDGGVLESTICQPELDMEARWGNPVHGSYMPVRTKCSFYPRKYARASAPVEL
jgi:hypothetical protein